MASTLMHGLLLLFFALTVIGPAINDRTHSISSDSSLTISTMDASARTDNDTSTLTTRGSDASNYYIIVDVPTSDDLDAFISKHNLPTNGLKGNSGASSKTYTVVIADSKASDLKEDPLVGLVAPCGIKLPGQYTSAGDKYRRQNQRSADPNLWYRLPADNHLVELGRDNANEKAKTIPGLLYDPSLGQGVTIYVMDTGWNSQHEEFQRRQGPIDSWAVPNYFFGALGDNDDEDRSFYDVDTEEFGGHGTGVAGLAGGVFHSLAPNAELIMVKHSGTLRLEGDDDEEIPPFAWPNALRAAMEYVIREIDRRGLQRKAVITNTVTLGSAANDEQGGFRADQRIWGDDWAWFIDQCGQRGVLIVSSAGNSGGSWATPREYAPLGWFWTHEDDPDDHQAPSQYSRAKGLLHDFPARLGTDTNSLITVGGTEPDGSLKWKSTPKFPYEGNLGSITFYAQASDLPIPRNNQNWDTEPGSGTSFTVGTIAGLVAYLLSTPHATFPGGNREFVQFIKRLLQNNAYGRRPYGQALDQGNLAPDYTGLDQLNYKDFIPDTCPIPINLAWKYYTPLYNPGDGVARRSMMEAFEGMSLEVRAPGGKDTTNNDTQVVKDGNPVLMANGVNVTEEVGFLLCPKDKTADTPSVCTSRNATNTTLSSTSEPTSTSSSTTSSSSLYEVDSSFWSSSSGTTSSTTSSSASTTSSNTPDDSTSVSPLCPLGQTPDYMGSTYYCNPIPSTSTSTGSSTASSHNPDDFISTTLSCARGEITDFEPTTTWCYALGSTITPMTSYPPTGSVSETSS
ncbi:MAG: hypothetical protein M1820_000135 [Bogoriella megaspora]|nr:MAG: hypothetical protein M1820_000135 [Bogoriella megaspora]